MNQKTLGITIVVVVAIVGVIGVWLAGVAGSGPLAGTICDGCQQAPVPLKTTLTLTATEVVGCEEGMEQRWIQFSGTLMDSNNTPIPYRPVTIYDVSGPYAVATLGTDINGAFSGPEGQGCCPITYYAAFVGNSQYQSSQSTTTAVPASNY